MKLFRLKLLIAVTLNISLALIMSPSVISAAEGLKFSAIPDEDTSRLMQRFMKVAEYLTKTSGIAVEYVPVKSYQASVEAFQNNQIQLAWFGGLTGVQARRAVPGSEAIVQGEEDQEFVSYFIANESTGLKLSETFPQEILGKTFTFGAKTSTSGRLMPEFYLRQHLKKSPEEAFKRVGFSEDHSKTLALVQSGAYDVGVLNYKVYETEVAKGIADPKKAVLIWKTPTYFDYQWTIRGDVDAKFGAGIKKKITEALLNMADKELLEAFPRKKFIPANNEMYKPILETAISIGLIEK